MCGMKGTKQDQQLRKRIREGTVRRADVVRLLAEMAFGQANDCVRLVLEEKPELEKLDLSLLSEVKRNDRGTVEVKLLDRMRVLERLWEAIGQEGGGELESFLKGIRSGEGK